MRSYRLGVNIRIVETELQRFLRAEPVDLEQVKVKLQDIERLKVELRLARVRAIEEGKALLSLERRQKLQSLLAEVRYSSLGNALSDLH